MPEDISGSENLTNGAYQKPSPKDQGSDVYDTLEIYMERMANHTHSGSDSQQISLNFTKEFQDLTVGVDLTWTDLGDSNYRATIAIPAVATYDGNLRQFLYKPNAGGNYKEFKPSVEKIDDNNFYVFANDNTIDLRIVYF